MIGQKQNAFDVIGFSRDEVDSVLELVSAVMKLGDIRFKSLSSKNGMANSIVDNEEGIMTWCGLVQPGGESYNLGARDKLSEGVS